METLVRTPLDDPPELHLLTTWEQDRERARTARILSVAAHIAGIVALLLMPRSFMQTTPRHVEQITPLIEPPTELTQKAPNKGPVAKEVSVEALQPRPRVQIPNAPPSTTRPRASNPAPPQAAPAPLPEPPQIASNQQIQPPRGLPAGPQTQAPPPQIQEQEKPKLAFETPTAPPPSAPTGRYQRPDTSVAGAIRELTHGTGAGGLVVGDDLSEQGPGGLGSGANLPSSPGRSASQLQLLSDPRGVDFRPYL